MPNAPLIWNVPIVDPDTGRPTPAFLRAWQKARGILDASEALATPGGAGTFLEGNSPPSWSTITEAKLALSDNTTNNATALRHGFLPKLSGSASDAMLGDGTWGAISGGGLPGAAPTYRAGQTATGFTNSLNCTLPTGSVAGDTVYVTVTSQAVSTGVTSSGPQRLIYQDNTATMYVMCVEVHLSPTDISTGHVTATFASYNYCSVLCATFIGPCKSVGVVTQKSDTGTSPVVFNAPNAPAGAVAVATAHVYSNSHPTISPGTAGPWSAYNRSHASYYYTTTQASEPFTFTYPTTGEHLEAIYIVQQSDVLDAEVVFADNTQGDATTSAHGFLPKLSGTATQYLDGSGAWSTPSGGGGGGGGGGVFAGTINRSYGWTPINEHSAASALSTNLTVLKRIFMPANAQASSISLVMPAANATIHITPVIYADDAAAPGGPGTRLVYGSTATGLAQGLNTLSLGSSPYVITTAGWYWCGFNITVATLAPAQTHQTHFCYFTNSGSDTPPSPAGTPTYATGTAGNTSWWVDGIDPIGVSVGMLSSPDHFETAGITSSTNYISAATGKPLYANQIITGIKLLLAATWAGTTFDVGVYDQASTGGPGTLRASLTGTTSLAVGINTLAFSSPYTVPSDGVYWAVVLPQGGGTVSGIGQGGYHTRWFKSYTGALPTGPITGLTGNTYTQTGRYFWLY